MTDHPQINTDIEQTPRDKMGIALGTTLAAIIFGLVALAYAKQDSSIMKNTSYFFAITSLSIFISAMIAFFGALKMKGPSTRQDE